MTSPVVTSILSAVPALKPVAKQIFDADLVPVINSFEAKITTPILAELLQALTAVLEGTVDNALS